MMDSWDQTQTSPVNLIVVFWFKKSNDQLHGCL